LARGHVAGEMIVVAFTSEHAAEKRETLAVVE
jgi:hypothetical protein